MRHRGREAEPKPFALVPIPDEAPLRRKATTHERFRNLTGQLELALTVESEYLFVSSGGYEFDPQAKGDRPDVWHTFYRRNGQICIPATSIKGAIRAIVEAISNSCVLQSRPQERSQIDPAHRACQFRDEESPLCPACRLFGTTGYRGRVHFDDAFPQSDPQMRIVKIAELWEPKRWESARRFYKVKGFRSLPNRRPERNFRFVEAVSKGCQFRLTLRFENLSKEELGLVLHSLGWKIGDGKVVLAFTPKLGGAKPRCFGAVKFNPVQLHIWSGDTFNDLLKSQVKQGQEMLHFLAECLKVCRESELLHSRSWETLVQKLQPKDEPCPRGVY